MSRFSPTMGLLASILVDAVPEIAELDMNPLVITPDRGLVAIDARVIATSRTGDE